MTHEQRLYLDLMKKALTRSIIGTHSLVRHQKPTNGSFAGRLAYPFFEWVLAKRGLLIAKQVPNDQRSAEGGKDWPPPGDTMIGLTRLQNLEDCCVDVIERKIPGDFIETGVYRGGACVFMRAVLKAYQETTRQVWVADSFEGLPKPECPQDARDTSKDDSNGPSYDDVVHAFLRYNLLDKQVRFLPGWFKDTLPKVAIQHLSILRLDGDLYSSTIDALKNLYFKVSLGGYVIVDDYGSHPNQCGRAVDEFRKAHRVKDDMKHIDRHGVFWKVGS